MQKDGLGFPVYKEVTAIGQDHSKEFITQVDLVLCTESLLYFGRERERERIGWFSSNSEDYIF